MIPPATPASTLRSHWACPVCGVANALEDTVCRVCRACPAEGANPQHALEDVAEPAPWWRAVITAMLLGGGAFYLAAHMPETTPWAEALALGGRQGTMVTARGDLLKLALSDLTDITEQLEAAVERREPPPATLGARLEYLRRRWQLRGGQGRYPRLESCEVGIARAFDDLSSLMYQAQSRPGDVTVLRGATVLRQQIAILEVSLEHAQ